MLYSFLKLPNNMFKTAVIISVLLGILFFWFGFIFLPIFSIFIFPTVLYFIGYQLKVKKIIRCILISLLFMLSFFFSLWIVLYESFTPITSEWRYKGIIKKYEDNIIFEHFPKKIPNYAKSVKFQYTGLGHIYLKIEVEPDIFKDIYNSFDSKAIENADTPSDELKGFPYFHYIEEKVDEYKIIILYSKPYKDPSEDNHWNHGKVSGIAFNQKDYKIIYWNESW